MPGSTPMTARSPARWLAPIALVTAAVAVYAVVAPQGGDGTSGGGRTPAAARHESRPQTTTTSRPTHRRTYTVRAGDTLSGIAERTGVPLAALIRLNEGVDSQSLQTGQRLKLAP
jgi:LysM repeat protein